MGEQQNQQSTQTPPKNKSKTTESLGEYIDYEEID